MIRLGVRPGQVVALQAADLLVPRASRRAMSLTQARRHWHEAAEYSGSLSAAQDSDREQGDPVDRLCEVGAVIESEEDAFVHDPAQQR